MFASRPHDPDTGLIDMRARWYSPDIGRFLSPDPAGLVDGTNLYAYASNDPVNFFDPSGLARQATEGNPGLGNFFAGIVDRISGAFSDFAMSVGGVFSGNPLQMLAARWDQQRTLADAELMAMMDAYPGAATSAIAATAMAFMEFADSVLIDPLRFGQGFEDGTLGGAFQDVLRATVIAGAVAKVVKLGRAAMAARSVAAIEEAGAARGLARGRKVSPCSINSFTADTLVWTRNGLKPISEIRIGDEVWARGEEDDTEGWREVEHLFATAGKTYLEVTVAGKSGERETIEATEKHPFWVVGKGWTDASELVPGQELISVDGGLLRVVSVESVDAVDDVYNFEVDELHTYFVGEIGVWVHNAGPCDPQNPGRSATRTRWGKEHGRGNVRLNNAIEDELDWAADQGATSIRKNRVQRSVGGERVSARKPDASYVLDGKRHNTNYVSNHELNNVNDLNRELDAFNAISDADPNAVTSLRFKY